MTTSSTSRILIEKRPCGPDGSLRRVITRVTVDRINESAWGELLETLTFGRYPRYKPTAHSPHIGPSQGGSRL